MIPPHAEAPAGPAPVISPFDDNAWEDLLNDIEEKRGIPIVGPELLTVETESGPRVLLDWLAEKLAVRLNVAIGGLPQPKAGNKRRDQFLALSVYE